MCIVTDTASYGEWWYKYKRFHFFYYSNNSPFHIYYISDVLYVRLKTLKTALYIATERISHTQQTDTHKYTNTKARNFPIDISSSGGKMYRMKMEYFGDDVVVVVVAKWEEKNSNKPKITTIITTNTVCSKAYHINVEFEIGMACTLYLRSVFIIHQRYHSLFSNCFNVFNRKFSYLSKCICALIIC